MNMIETHHLESATRALNMWATPTKELRDLAEEHDAIDMFASKVIAAAARHVIAERALG